MQTDTKREKKVTQALDTEFSYLAGNAFGKDKKGRPKKDDASGADAVGAAAEQGDYSPHVLYSIDVERAQ